jgi:hypothetical protein
MDPNRRRWSRPVAVLQYPHDEAFDAALKAKPQAKKPKRSTGKEAKTEHDQTTVSTPRKDDRNRK